MNRRLALLTGGYFVVIGIVLVAVLPFAINVLRIETAIQRRLAPATSHARALLAAALDQETAEHGYVVTGDKTFLPAYHMGQSAAASARRRLNRLPLKHDERAALQATVDALGTWEREYAAHEIALVRSGNDVSLVEARAADATRAGRACSTRSGKSMRPSSTSSSVVSRPSATTCTNKAFLRSSRSSPRASSRPRPLWSFDVGRGPQASVTNSSFASGSPSARCIGWRHRWQPPAPPTTSPR